jgi:hypothetical protein
MLSKETEKIQKVRLETGEKAAQLFSWLNSQKKIYRSLVLLEGSTCR